MDRLSQNFSNPLLTCCHNTIHPRSVRHQTYNYHAPGFSKQCWYSRVVAVLCPRSGCISVVLHVVLHVGSLEGSWDSLKCYRKERSLLINGQKQNNVQ